MCDNCHARENKEEADNNNNNKKEEDSSLDNEDEDVPLASLGRTKWPASDGGKK